MVLTSILPIVRRGTTVAAGLSLWVGLSYLTAVTAVAGPEQPGDQQPPRIAPVDVTLCEVAKDPDRFDNGRIRLTGLVNFAFEDFTLWDPSCQSSDTDFDLWLTYGGSASSGAIYCCPGEGVPRSSPAAFPLVQDQPYRAFRALLDKERDTVVRTTLVGTLLVKKKPKTELERFTIGGYGHLGCCSLLIIERVESYDPHDRTDLDYSASSGYYLARDLRCRAVGREEWELKDAAGRNVFGARFGSAALFLQQQAAAETGERSWAFSDPARVALESVRKLHGDSVKSGRRARSLPGRYSFEWEQGSRLTTVVVARPYWLSLYAKSSQVAWVVTAQKTAWCESLSEATNVLRSDRDGPPNKRLQPTASAVFFR